MDGWRERENKPVEIIWDDTQCEIFTYSSRAKIIINENSNLALTTTSSLLLRSRHLAKQASKTKTENLLLSMGSCCTSIRVRWTLVIVFPGRIKLRQ